MALPAGSIAVISGALTRYLAFHRALAALERPAGTALHYSFGANVAENRNSAIRVRHGDWMWFLDDDHTFAPDTLIKLLKRGKDIISPIVLHKEPPHAPVMYDAFEERTEGPRYHRQFLTDQTGVQRMAAVGTGGMLVRREVLEALTDPWFEVGQFVSSEFSEDLWFCKKATEAGFEVWVDFDVPMAHVAPCAVWPVRTTAGDWATGYHLGGETMPFIAAAKDEEAG